MHNDLAFIIHVLSRSQTTLMAGYAAGQLQARRTRVCIVGWDSDREKHPPWQACFFSLHNDASFKSGLTGLFLPDILPAIVLEQPCACMQILKGLAEDCNEDKNCYSIDLAIQVTRSPIMIILDCN